MTRPREPAFPMNKIRKILIVTPANSATYQHTHGLIRCGYEVERVDFLPLIREGGIRHAERRIREAAERAAPDLILATLCGDHFQFPIDFFADLRRRWRLVFWLWDDENNFDAHSKYYAQAADAVVTTDIFSVAGYEKRGIAAVLCFTPVAKEICHPAQVEQDIDVSFVGDCLKRDRMEFIRYLATNGVRVETFGRGSKNGALREEELATVFSRSKVNLNFSKLDELSWLNEDDPTLWNVRGNKGRPIEIAMAGGFCLTEYYPALPHIFKIGEEADCFFDRVSLLEKARFYLSHDAERLALARRGHERAMSEYEAQRYIPRVMSSIEAIFQSRSPTSPIRVGRTFGTKRVNVLFVHLLSALERRQPGVALEIAPALLEHGLVAFLYGVWGGLRRSASLFFKRFSLFREVL